MRGAVIEVLQDKGNREYEVWICRVSDGGAIGHQAMLMQITKSGGKMSVAVSGTLTGGMGGVEFARSIGKQMLRGEYYGS